jgi:hypothetical protein
VLRVIIYFNYFFNIPHMMMQIPLSSLSVNVLIQIFLFIVCSAAVVLSRRMQPLSQLAEPLPYAMTPPWSSSILLPSLYGSYSLGLAFSYPI